MKRFFFFSRIYRFIPLFLHNHYLIRNEISSSRGRCVRGEKVVTPPAAEPAHVFNIEVSSETAPDVFKFLFSRYNLETCFWFLLLFISFFRMYVSLFNCFFLIIFHFYDEFNQFKSHFFYLYDPLLFK